MRVRPRHLQGRRRDWPQQAESIEAAESVWGDGRQAFYIHPNGKPPAGHDPQSLTLPWSIPVNPKNLDDHAAPQTVPFQ